MCCAVKKADKEDKTKLLNKVDAFIFDCDGKDCKSCHQMHPAAISQSKQHSLHSHITTLVTCRCDLEGRLSY